MFNKLPTIEVNELESMDHLPELLQLKLVCHNCGNKLMIDGSKIETEHFFHHHENVTFTKCGNAHLKFAFEY